MDPVFSSQRPEFKRGMTMIMEALESPNRRPSTLGDPVWITEYDGRVMLVDDEHRLFAMNGVQLQQWYTCPACLRDGFAEAFFRRPALDRRCRACGALYFLA